MATVRAPRSGGGHLGQNGFQASLKKGKPAVPGPKLERKDHGKTGENDDGQNTYDDLRDDSPGLSHVVSAIADSVSRNSSGVSLRNPQKLKSGKFRPSRPCGV